MQTELNGCCCNLCLPVSGDGWIEAADLNAAQVLFLVSGALHQWLILPDVQHNWELFGVLSLKPKTNDPYRSLISLCFMYICSACRLNDCEVLPENTCSLCTMLLYWQRTTGQLSMHLLDNIFFLFIFSIHVRKMEGWENITWVRGKT